MSEARDRSLQEAMRARRRAAPLLTPEQLRQRQEERQRAETEREAARLVERRRQHRTPVDAEGRLPTPVYQAIFALDRDSYYGSRHWARRSKAQRVATPQCEVEGCFESGELQVQHLGYRALGEEKIGVDLITLCDRCRRRAQRQSRARSRPLTRREIVKLDPDRPLYQPATIAALKAKYARPLRRSDLPDG